MSNYVLGFAFTPDLKSVLLLTKGHRAAQSWQNGRLNGVGGAIKEGETPADAMYREGKEEADIEPRAKWQEFGVVHGTGFDVPFSVHLFVAASAAFRIDPNCGEPTGLYSVKDLPDYKGCHVPDLRWLVHMALYTLEGANHFDHFEITASRKIR